MGPTFLTSKETAALLKVAEKTLEGWRRNGTGPKFIRMQNGRSVRYDLQDVTGWLSPAPATAPTEA